MTTVWEVRLALDDGLFIVELEARRRKEQGVLNGAAMSRVSRTSGGVVVRHREREREREVKVLGIWVGVRCAAKSAREVGKVR